MKIKLWILDVNYEIVADEPEIKLWGITSEGKRALVKIRGFRPYFYAVPKEGVPIEDAIRSIKVLATQYKILSVEKVKRKYYGRPLDVIKVTCKLPPSVPKLREAVAKLKAIEDVLEADISRLRRNPLLIGSTVLTYAADHPRNFSNEASRNPLLIGSTVLTETSTESPLLPTTCRNPLLIGSTVLT